MDESSAAQRILLRADKILAAVDEAYIITKRNHKPRLMPTFRPEEITLGKVLGTGGFGVVNEIAKFTLDLPGCESEDEAQEAEQKVGVGNSNHDREYGDPALAIESTTEKNSAEQELHDSHVHYDIRQARCLMEKRCARKGVTRYALKRLHNNLSELERARGMVDLAVEAKFLSVVWHPNIGKWQHRRSVVARFTDTHSCAFFL